MQAYPLAGGGREVTQAASEPQIEAEHESVSLLLLLFTVEFTRPIGRNEMVMLCCANNKKGQCRNLFAADDPVLGSRNLALIQDFPARTLLALRSRSVKF